jgi:two-component system LytT family response regulator
VNVQDAIDKIEIHQPQLIFLDIQMPGNKTGFDLLEVLDYTPKVIFITAYHEFAIKAFEFNALDYLLKPVETKRLSEAIQKVKKNMEQDIIAQKNYLGLQDQVFVKDGERCWFVKLGDVRLFESVGNYAKVFFRANRKHIINLLMIQKIDSHFNGGLKVTLQGGEQIEVSRRQAVKFRESMSL